MRRPKGQQKNPARGFGAVGLQPFLVFCVFCLFAITLFSPENGFVCSFFSVSLFSPWFLSLFLSHSLSLSLSLSCFFFCFLAFLFIIFFPCFFCCFFLPCFFAFVCFTEKVFERLFFINYFCFLGFPVLFCLSNPFFFICVFFVLSVVFLVNINVFQFSKKTISKTLSFVSRIVQSYRFCKGPIWGQIWVMFEKHCKNRHFSTGLRAL